MFEALLKSYALKHTARAGWLRAGVAAPESVAAHSWGLSFLVLCLLPDELSRERALTYAAVHDLAESVVGDITPHDGVSSSEKVLLEREGMAALCAAGLPESLASLWTAYEAQTDPEARFVRELDRLDMALQALLYSDRAPTEEFLTSAAKVVTHPRLTAVLQEAMRRYPGGQLSARPPMT